MRYKYLAPLLALVLLAGCGGDDTLKQGTIIGKHHEDASTTVIPIPIYTTICITSGTTTSCHPQLIGIFPYYVTDDEDWVLRLKDCKEDSRSDKPVCRTGNAYVTESEYNRLQAGDYFGEDESKYANFSDPKTKKRKG